MQSSPHAAVVHVTDTLRLRVWCVHTERALQALLPECRTDAQRRACARAVLRRHEQVRKAFLRGAERWREAHRLRSCDGWLHPEMPLHPDTAWSWWMEHEREKAQGSANRG
jgi:hypothetical protein